MPVHTPDIDPLENLGKIPDGKKYCTHCGVLKAFSKFHKDESKEDGRRDVCKDCRSDLAEQKRKSALAEQLKEFENEGLKTFETLQPGGSFDPHINEVFEAVLRPFGGVNGWAKHIYATYLACEPGSQKRIKIHDMMFNLAKQTTKLGLAERKLDMMEERDLALVMKEYLVEYQEGNSLPPTAIPMSDGEVIDIAREDIQ